MSLLYTNPVLEETNETKGTGWLQSMPDLRDYTPETPKIAEMAKALKITGKVTSLKAVPAAVDLRAWCSPIEDQKTIGSCTAHAAVGIVEYFERRAFGTHLDGSRLFVYKMTRNLMGVTGDTGAWLRNTMGALVLGGFMALLATLSATALAGLSSILGNLTLFGLIMLFLVIGALRKVKVYEAFVEGAKEGFDVAKNLLPYLVAMLCAVGVLRASGALDFGLDGIRHVVEWLGWDTRFVDALPTAMVKPFSGSAARALLIETMQTQGVDSFPALVAATVQGSTETTFYVLAVYFGAVGIQRARHAVGCALLAEFSGVVAAIGVCYWFFG